MASELDIGPLTWVKGEIDRALDQARQNLAGFFANPGDLSPLRYCLTHLHQVNGAILMVGLEGAARVCGEIEKLVAALEKQDAAPSAANGKVVNQAIAALSEYLASLLAGEPDVPLRLYPIYQSLHRARNSADFAESDLFFPDLSARAPKDVHAQPVGETELQALAKTERARFQWGLLKFLHTPDDAAGLEEMRMALLAIERAQSLPAQRTFWWSAGALIESLLNKGLSPDADAKRLLGKIDQQIRKLAESSATVAEHLLRELLYRLALSQPVSERIKQVKQAFALDGCLPQTAPVAADAGGLTAAAEQLKGGEKTLAIAAEIITPASVPATEPIAPEPLPETEIMIGDVTLPRELFEIYKNEARQRIDVLRAELARLEDRPDLPIREDFVRAAHTLCGISRTVGFPAPAALGFELEEWLGEMRAHPQPAKANQVKVTGAAVVALNKMVRAIEEQKMPKPAKPVMLSLQALVAKARAERAPAKDVKPAAALVPADSPREEERRAEGVRPATFVEPTATSTDDIDADILSLFLEEAQDLYPLVGTQLRAWRETPANPQASQDLLRSLHTFKGGARMAGALQLGVLVHNLESRVVDSTEAGIPAALLFDELFTCFDQIGDLLERLRAGPEAPIPKEIAADQPDSPPMEASAKPGAQHLRVRADVLDRLINEAGEISIARSRIEGEMQGFKQSLLELTENVGRLRNQVREIEIQAESRMQSQANQTGGAEAFDPLEFDRFTHFQELTRFLAEGINDVATVQQSLLKNLGEADAALRQQARQNRELQQDLMHLRMVPLSSIADRLQRIVRQTARELDKKANLEIQGGEVELDRSVLEKMTAPLEHLLRNSLAHGVESAAERIRAGKPEAGTVRIGARREDGEIVLTLSDDGAGFDLADIRSHAVKLGRIPADGDIGQARLIDMIFDPGFSTALEVTQVAGRGVGLDVVRNEIGGLGGRVEAASGENGGAAFSVYLPLTLAVSQAVLVRTGENIYALPSAMVELVKEYKSAELEEFQRKGEVEWQNNLYPLFYLPRLLGEPERVPETQRYVKTLLLRSGIQRVAIQVDEILGNQEIVIKNIGPQLARIPGIAGATVLGNGGVALIINPVHLLQRWAQQDASVAPKVAAVARIAAPLIMVVDDSLTVRKITSRLLEKEGYRVVTAKDGVDALERAQEALPDVMLVDIEMPRMDGFELTRIVRSDPRTAHIPIIMITSRTAEKHRNYAKELGVNAYLGKPFQEDELLGHIAGFLRAGFLKKPTS